MKFAEMNPYVRMAEELTLTPDTAPVCGYDSRLFYVERGKNRLVTDAEEIPLSEGRFVYLPAGCRYAFAESRSLTLLLVAFDWEWKYAEESDPIPVVVAEDWDASACHRMPDCEDYPDFGATFSVRAEEAVREELAALVREFGEKKRLRAEQASARLKLVLAGMLRSRLIGSRAEEAVANVLGYIREHYREEIPNRAFGALTGYHPYYLNKLMLEETGQSLHQHLVSYRIAEAERLLLATDMTASAIAEATGFGGLPAFSASFKKQVGVSPAGYRQRERTRRML